MNTREIAVDVYKHPLIQEILKQQIISPSIVNQLIVEEVMQEAPGDSIRRALSGVIKKHQDPKAAATAIQKFLTGIKSGEEDIYAKLFPGSFAKWPPGGEQRQNFMKAGVKYAPNIHKRITAKVEEFAKDGKIDSNEQDALIDQLTKDLTSALETQDSNKTEAPTDAAGIKKTLEKWLDDNPNINRENAEYLLLGATLIASVFGSGWLGILTAIDAANDIEKLVGFIKNEEYGKALELVLVQAAAIGVAFLPGGAAFQKFLETPFGKRMGKKGVQSFLKAAVSGGWNIGKDVWNWWNEEEKEDEVKPQVEIADQVKKYIPPLTKAGLNPESEIPAILRFLSSMSTSAVALQEGITDNLRKYGSDKKHFGPTVLTHIKKQSEADKKIIIKVLGSINNPKGAEAAIQAASEIFHSIGKPSGKPTPGDIKKLLTNQFKDLGPEGFAKMHFKISEEHGGLTDTFRKTMPELDELEGSDEDAFDDVLQHILRLFGITDNNWYHVRKFLEKSPDASEMDPRKAVEIVKNFLLSKKSNEKTGEKYTPEEKTLSLALDLMTAEIQNSGSPHQEPVVRFFQWTDSPQMTNELVGKAVKAWQAAKDEPTDSTWFDNTLKDEQRAAINKFVEIYNSFLAEGLAGVVKKAALPPALVKRAIKQMKTANPEEFKILKNIMINYPDDFAIYLKGLELGTEGKPEDPEEGLPQKEDEADFDASKPMINQIVFAENLANLFGAKIIPQELRAQLKGAELDPQGAFVPFEKSFMRVPLLMQQQAIYIDLINALKTLFSEEASLTRGDKGAEAEPKPETEETPEVEAESLIREEPAPQDPDNASQHVPEAGDGVKSASVDKKVLKNIKIDLRYIENAMTKLNSLLKDFIAGGGATRRFAQEGKQKIIDYATQVQMKLAETYSLISSIAPLNEEVAEMSREQKIDMVEDVWDNAVPGLNELKTLVTQAVSYEELNGKANEILQLLDTIKMFFPKTAKFTPDAKRGSADAMRELFEKTESFKAELLPRIYALLKDQKLDSTRINRTLTQLQSLSMAIQELLGIKSQIKDAPTPEPPSDDPEEPSLTDDPDPNLTDTPVDTDEEEEEQEDDALDPTEPEIKKIKDPRAYVREAKKLLPYKTFAGPTGLPEATPEMYDAFMMLYAAIISEWHNPGGQSKPEKDRERETLATEAETKKKFKNMIRLQAPLITAFGQEAIETSGVESLLTSVQRDTNLAAKKAALLEIFNTYSLEQIKKVITLMDSKIKGKIALDAWKQQEMYLMNFIKDDKEEGPKADADGQYKLPGFEESLVRKLIPIVESMLSQTSKGQVPYEEKLISQLKPVIAKMLKEN